MRCTAAALKCLTLTVHGRSSGGRLRAAQCFSDRKIRAKYNFILHLSVPPFAGMERDRAGHDHIHCQERDANIFGPRIFKVAGSVSHSRLMRLQTLTSRIPVVTAHCYFTPPDLYLVFTPSLGLAAWVAPKTPSAVLRTQGPTPSPRSAGRGLCDGCYFPAI